jgi:hypothetical protein
MNHMVDPDNFPDDASVASYLTLEEDDMKSLEDPFVFVSVKEALPVY